MLFPHPIIGQEKGIDAFNSYQLNKKHRKVKLTDLIQEVEFIRLQETPKSLLGNLYNVHIVGDKFVFAGDKLKGDIFVFDSQGKFVNRINRKGVSPGDYFSLTDIWIEGDLIAVFSSQRGIKRYRLNGDFVSESKLDLRAGHAFGKANQYFLNLQSTVTVDEYINGNRSPEQVNYDVAQLDADMNILEMHLPNTRKVGGFISGYSIFFDYKESLVFCKPMSDTVYKYFENKFVPLVQFDFGDYWHWDHYDALDGNIMQGLRASNKAYSIRPKIGSRYIYSYTQYGSGAKNLELWHLIDRKNSEIVLVDLNRSSKKGAFDLQFSHWESDDTFYAFLPSLDAVGLVTEATRKNWSFRGGTNLEEIASSENPVLVRIKVKDFSKD